MGFTSILDKEESTYVNRRRPEYLLDLNLNQIIDAIQFQWLEDIRGYYRYFPENEACEAYRREVYGDIKKEDMQRVLENYVNQMRERSKAAGHKDEVDLDMQKEIWHLWEVYDYCMAYDELCQNLTKLQPASEGFQKLREYLLEYVSGEGFRRMKEQACDLIARLQGFHLVLTLEDNRIVISSEELPGTYENFLKESFPGNKASLRSPFAASPGLTNLEMELLTAFRKKNPDFFKEVNRFYKEYSEYADGVLLRFYKEIGFYLGFYKFEEHMKSEGFAFAVPTVDSASDMQAAGLYDLALAYVNHRQGKTVVSNDMAYHKGEQFFVVTGPNQGGKTTFARSLGQLVYFTKMGLDVPATVANVPYFSDILTHFSVEESIESGRGKLKEELERLAPMMDAVFEQAFVIINELFTTAANYDACIMGKRVLEHFLEQGCQGVYVTHLKELSEGDERIVSLRALVEEITVEQEDAEEGDSRRTCVRNVRKYKMIRGEAEDLGYAGDLVDKYRLNYLQIKKRMSENRTCDRVDGKSN